MNQDVLIELLRDVPSVATLIGIIIGVRVTVGNRRIANVERGVIKTAIAEVSTKVDTVQSQTNGLTASLTAAAEAKGIEAGHAAGVASGVLAGVIAASAVDNTKP